MTKMFYFEKQIFKCEMYLQYTMILNVIASKLLQYTFGPSRAIS